MTRRNSEPAAGRIGMTPLVSFCNPEHRTAAVVAVQRSATSEAHDGLWLSRWRQRHGNRHMAKESRIRTRKTAHSSQGHAKHGSSKSSTPDYRAALSAAALLLLLLLPLLPPLPSSLASAASAPRRTCRHVAVAAALTRRSAARCRGARPAALPAPPAVPVPMHAHGGVTRRERSVYDVSGTLQYARCQELHGSSCGSA